MSIGSDQARTLIAYRLQQACAALDEVLSYLTVHGFMVKQQP
jgi:hypothetical protein